MYDRKRDRVRPSLHAPTAATPTRTRRRSAATGRKVAFYVNSGTFGSGSFVYGLRSGDRRRVGGDTADLSLDGRFATGVDYAHKRVNGQRVTNSRVFRLNLRSGRRTVASEPIHRPDRNDLLSEAWEPSISGAAGRSRLRAVSDRRPGADGRRSPTSSSFAATGSRLT